jgi:hypothetical protein
LVDSANRVKTTHVNLVREMGIDRLDEGEDCVYI